MSDDTRLDRLLRWFKNNPAFSILMLVALGVVAISQFVGALSNLIATGRELRSTTTSTTRTITGPVTIPATATSSDVAIVAEYGGKGSGPGLFTDARFLAIDRAAS